MAEYHLIGQQNSGVNANFYTYRPVFGAIYFRFTDIDISGFQWSTASSIVRMWNRSQAQVGAGTVSRTWGQPGNWVYMFSYGNSSQAIDIRMGVDSFYVNPYNPNQFTTWKGDILYG